jgi:DNA polymerase III sliding clamp (beta) subunit (PCNA family)
MGLSFKINVKGLLAGIQPAVTVSTTNVVKGYAAVGHISLEATPECLFANANSGRMSVRNPIHYITTSCTDYEFKSAGVAAVRAADLITVLQSFDRDEVLLVETGDAPKEALPENATEEERLSWSLLTGDELRLRPQSDPEQVQTLPVLTVKIETLSATEKPSQQVQLSRPVFCRALSRVLFAGGTELRREKFTYWMLRSDRGKSRFVATSGQRLAQEDVKAEHMTTSTARQSFMIPVEPSQTLLKVLGDNNNPHVDVRHYGRKICFEAGSLQVVVTGLNPNLNWIDEDKYVIRNNRYLFTVPVVELDMAVKGMLATQSEETKKREPVLAANLTFDTEKKTVTFSSDKKTKKALRKIRIADSYVADDNPPVISFRCAVSYLAEVVKYADKNQYVQMELVTKDLPMVVRFYGGEKTTQEALVNENIGISAKEEFLMMIAKMGDE